MIKVGIERAAVGIITAAKTVLKMAVDPTNLYLENPYPANVQSNAAPKAPTIE
jgi:hypothetical protein